MSAQNEAISSPESAASTATSVGPDGNVLGALSYILSPIGGILVYLLEEENEFARFHAAQSIVFGVAALAISTTVWVFSTVFSLLMPDLLGFLVWLISFLAQGGIGLVLFVMWAYLFIMAFQGKRTSLPVVGSIAESYLL
ncbi:DUF4870 domain-containing protein [Natrinema halophilum]|uniref:DUF4870 domain-containing protein n=1 Tax=Natrinema halophilum TaxID=1699371 RepID=A0A7D5GRG7_9EURY|nr:DUF4870 domain-containing protein [Natrinema halophilum]QLG48026.1 DUF4870 domain-containing protein [Natrinema halophilum]